MLKFLKRFRNEKGMSLIEIMIVLGIIAAASAAILNTVIKGSEKAKIKQAKTQIHQLTAYIKMYKNDEGKYPSSDLGIEALVEAGFYDELPVDPWNNEFTYVFPGNNKKFDLCSSGPDEDTEEDDVCNYNK